MGTRSLKRFGVFFFILAVIAAIVFFGYALLQGNTWGRIPTFSLRMSGKALDAQATVLLGKQNEMTVLLENPASALCDIHATATQNNVTRDIYKNAGGASSLFPANQTVKQLEFPVSGAALLAQGFRDGPLTLTVNAKDCSLFHRTLILTRDLRIDVTPPRVSITSTQHYINQGGADVVTYQVSGDADWSGVKIGPYQFRGHRKPGTTAPQADGSGDYFTFFVFSYELPETTPIEVVAIDAAGNEAKATLRPARFFPKQFRHRDIPIDTKFIDTKVADIIANTADLQNQNDAVKNFLLVNSDLRKKNTQFLLALSGQSAETFFWKDAFRPLINAAVEANFADYRNYIYNNNKIDEQVHLGFDLATFEHDPVAAAGAGKVAHAGYLGIYGNTIIIDHGYGLMSLYGHLSQMDVKAGDLVKQDQKIGNTGTTGLAAGDHLHFSMMIDGVQTNPIEFWDQHWINDHVYLRIDPAFFGK